MIPKFPTIAFDRVTDSGKLGWSIEIKAFCPKCGQAIIPGTTEKGRLAMHCQPCKYSVPSSEEYDKVITEVLENAARIASKK